MSVLDDWRDLKTRGRRFWDLFKICSTCGKVHLGNVTVDCPRCGGTLYDKCR